MKATKQQVSVPIRGLFYLTREDVERIADLFNVVSVPIRGLFYLTKSTTTTAFKENV